MFIIDQGIIYDTLTSNPCFGQTWWTDPCKIYLVTYLTSFSVIFVEIKLHFFGLKRSEKATPGDVAVGFQ